MIFNAFHALNDVLNSEYVGDCAHELLAELCAVAQGN